MNKELKEYVESKTDKSYKNSEIGFLIVNKYKITPQKYVFTDCDVCLLKFDSEHTKIESIDGKKAVGSNNPEKLRNYKNSVTKEGELVSAQLCLHPYTLKEMLEFYALTNTKNKTLPNLDKDVFTQKEIENICSEAKKINFEDTKKANERSVNFAKK